MTAPHSPLDASGRHDGARAALQDALDTLVNRGETVEVSPAAHNITTLQLFDLARDIRARASISIVWVGNGALTYALRRRARHATRTISRHDDVRVPDGRIGEAIGYFLEADDNVLVLLDSGARRFLRTDLRLLNDRIDAFRAVAAHDVHHNSNDCTTGSFIGPFSRTAGDGGLPLCTECTALDFVA